MPMTTDYIETLAPWITRISAPGEKTHRPGFPGINWVVHFQTEGPWMRGDGHRGVGRTLEEAIADTVQQLRDAGKVP